MLHDISPIDRFLPARWQAGPPPINYTKPPASLQGLQAGRIKSVGRLEPDFDAECHEGRMGKIRSGSVAYLPYAIASTIPCNACTNRGIADQRRGRWCTILQRDTARPSQSTRCRSRRLCKETPRANNRTQSKDGHKLSAIRDLKAHLGYGTCILASVKQCVKHTLPYIMSREVCSE